MKTKIQKSILLVEDELISNTMKYAFIGRDSGFIHISITREDNHAVLIFEDNGVGMPVLESKKKRKSFGLMLIDLLIEQIGGICQIEGDNGTRVIIEFEI